jgi:PQQ enzyme-like repeat protein
LRNILAAIFLVSTVLLVQAPFTLSIKQPSQILQGTTDYAWAMFRADSLREGLSLTTAPTSPTLMWTKVTGAAVYASPVVSDGMVFIPSWDGSLYALDEYSGQLKWTFTTSGNIYSSPAVVSGIVYLASRDGKYTPLMSRPESKPGVLTIFSTVQPFQSHHPC